MQEKFKFAEIRRANFAMESLVDHIDGKLKPIHICPLLNLYFRKELKDEIC